MKSTHILGTSLAFLLAQVPVARAEELTLWHSWSNDSEMAALNTIVDEFESLPVFSSFEYHPLIAPAVMPWTKKRPSAK